jgi:hypothetical protein
VGLIGVTYPCEVGTLQSEPMAIDRTRTLRGALAGAAAAAIWALQQPLDKRVFGCRYDDVELLGRTVVPHGGARTWYPIGLALHIQNGALFGAVYANVAPRAGAALPPAARGPLAGLVEHAGLWPLGRLSDRFHPAREELLALAGSRRAFWQAAWRHALFGLLLGELERRWNAVEEPQRDPAAEAFAQYVSSNGRGNIEHAALGRT